MSKIPRGDIQLRQDLAKLEGDYKVALEQHISRLLSSDPELTRKELLQDKRQFVFFNEEWRSKRQDYIDRYKIRNMFEGFMRK